MNKESLSAFGKISAEMDRLSYLINKEEIFRQQLQSALQERRSSSSSSLDDLDLCFRDYDNPTAKSLPFDQDSETINTLYRIRPDDNPDHEEPIPHDDKSTVILPGRLLRTAEKQWPEEEKIEKEGPYEVIVKGHAKYSSACRDIPSKKEAKPKKNCKNGTASMPSEVYASNDSQKLMRNVSAVKGGKGESVNGKRNLEGEEALMRELKGKLSKVSRIDREELNRLQQKKNANQNQKKAEPSSNRKKTKRESNSKVNPNAPKPSHSLTNLRPPLRTTKSQWPSHVEKAADKTGKKLNRVNIVKLQQNMRKAQAVKPVAKGGRKQQPPKELQLHFTEQDEENPLKQLIAQKQLGREYARQNDKYQEASKKVGKAYLQQLIRECRQPSEEAVFKLRLVALTLYFFQQFATTPLTSQRRGETGEEFLSRVGEEEVVGALLRPKRLLKLIEQLPNTLGSSGSIAGERLAVFQSQFAAVNEQLEQQLQFFLLKKTPLFAYLHSLSEYIKFLLLHQLVSPTQRSRLAAKPQPKMRGFYSSRSKRDEVAPHYLKKKEGNQLGFRCDSDRKITIEDEDFCFRLPRQQNRPESAPKVARKNK